MEPGLGLRAPHPSPWPKLCPNNASRAFHGVSMGFHQDVYFSQVPLMATGIWDLGFLPPSCSARAPQPSGYKKPLHLQSGFKIHSPQAHFRHPESLSPDSPHFKDLDVCLAFLYLAAELCAGHGTAMPRPETNVCCRHLVTRRNVFLCLLLQPRNPG